MTKRPPVFFWFLSILTLISGVIYVSYSIAQDEQDFEILESPLLITEFATFDSPYENKIPGPYVEIHNTNPVDPALGKVVDLSNFSIQTASGSKYTFPPNTTIPGQGYVVVDFSGTGAVQNAVSLFAYATVLRADSQKDFFKKNGANGLRDLVALVQNTSTGTLIHDAVGFSINPQIGLWNR
jgi:hypothetical protein